MPAADPPLVRAVVTTKDRPERLRASVEAILAQRPAPASVTVLEGGDLDAAGAAIAPFVGGDAEVSVLPQARDADGRSNKSASWERHVRPWREGYVQFVDDDVLVAPDYADRLVRALEVDAARRHVAARGQLAERVPGAASRYDVAFATLFLHPRPGRGRFQPSGYQTHLLPPHGFRIVDTGGMGFLLARAAALHAVGFEPWFTGASTHEDVDLCLRLRRVGTVLQVPGAFARHLRAGEGRDDVVARERMAARNHAFVWRRHAARSPFHLACFLWSEAGAVVNHVADFRSPRHAALSLCGVRAARAYGAVVGRARGWADALRDAWADASAKRRAPTSAARGGRRSDRSDRG